MLENVFFPVVPHERPCPHKKNIGMLGMQELFFCWGGGGDIVVLMEYYVS